MPQSIFSIDKLRAAAGGFAKGNRYNVNIIPPSGIPTLQSDPALGKFQYMCEAISLPTKSLASTPQDIYGPTREIVQGYSYAEITGVFRCSSDMREKLFFETWQRLAYNPQTWALGYYDEYSGGIEIYSLDQQNKRRYGVQLIECFPKTIAAQSLTATTASDVQKLSVTFSYRYWKNLTDEADLPKPLRDRIEEVVVNSAERQLRAAIPRVLSRL